MNKEFNILRHSSLKELASFERSYLPDFSVFSIDHQKDPENKYSFLNQGFRSDFFSVIHVLQGSVVAKVNFLEVLIEKDNLFITTPDNIKQLVYVSDDCILEGVSFTSDFLAEIKLQYNYMALMEYFSSRYDHLWKLNAAESDLFSDLVLQMKKRIALLDSHAYGKELLGTSFAVFLFEMAEIAIHRVKSVNLKFGRKEELIRKFNKLAIQHHLTERNLSFYGEQLFVTSKYLSETVKEITGRTAGQFIDELNIQEAKRLLESTDLSVSEIAFQLQFSSPAFFSKFFKRFCHLSPRDYRLSLFQKNFDPGN